MTIFVLEQNLRPIEAITQFVSLVWTERYDDYGEFELVCEYKYHLYEIFKLGNLISINTSDRLMVIEDRAIETNEGLPTITITGRSFEKVLADRVVFRWPWSPSVSSTITKVVTNISWRFDGNFQNTVEVLFNLCFGKYSVQIAGFSGSDLLCGPGIPYLQFRRSSDPNVTSVTEYDEGVIQDLYSILIPKIQDHELGFRMVYSPKDDYTQSKIYAEVYKGADRSENQSDRIPVIFSESYQNLKSSRYYETNREAAWYSIKVNEDGFHEAENGDVPWGTYNYGFGATFDFQSTKPLESRIVPLIVTNYFNQERYPDLTDSQRNSLENAEVARMWNAYKREEVFEAELLPNGYFVFGKDYFLGDIVSIDTEFGVRATARVTEVVRSYDEIGEHILPTFQVQTFTVVPPPDTST